MFNTSSTEGLQALEKHLSSSTYVSGFSPSQKDAQLLTSFTSSPDAQKFPSVSRWFQHISSFPEQERKAWITTGGASKTSTTAQPASHSQDTSARLVAAEQKLAELQAKLSVFDSKGNVQSKDNEATLKSLQEENAQLKYRVKILIAALNREQKRTN
eukprot:TRINITY_DN3515_c0_g3_i2.p1 TRINITY_DN3515_c0_g3~~TRINITY_DN3515_c0_g3_i2.p1  ORF type:complete len:157 (+),score=46.91 TRINITY_DN3515_c0_g3_i2:52-522(+)